MMTGLLRRVREMAEREGRKRGRPILIATRVPDSAGYCRAVGLDLQRWLQEDLIDILVGGFYMRLNPWEYLVQLGHRHGVAVYAGLSESRVRGDASPFGRNSEEGYRGRALRAWQAGVDGIYLFNYFQPEGGILRQIGDPGGLRKLDRIYYATLRNRNPDSYLARGRRYLNVPILTPQNPARIQVGEARNIDLALGEDLAGAREPLPDVKLHLQVSGAGDLSVQFNGTALAGPRKSGVWTVFPVPPRLLRPGGNEVSISAEPESIPPSGEENWSVVYRGTGRPEAPWSMDRQRDCLICRVRDGALFLADRGRSSGDYLYCSYPWNIDPEGEAVVEARVRVLSGWNNIIVANGRAYERVSLYPDRVSFYEARISRKMDTTDGFHTYRIVLKGRDIKVFADGHLALDGTGRFTRALPGRNDIRFGAANSPSLGEALWQSVKLRFQRRSVMLHDMVLTVRSPGPDG